MKITKDKLKQIIKEILQEEDVRGRDNPKVYVANQIAGISQQLLRDAKRGDASGIASSIQLMRKLLDDLDKLEQN